jgi:hypothetical protein
MERFFCKESRREQHPAADQHSRDPADHGPSPFVPCKTREVSAAPAAASPSYRMIDCAPHGIILKDRHFEWELAASHSTSALDSVSKPRRGEMTLRTIIFHCQVVNR